MESMLNLIINGQQINLPAGSTFAEAAALGAGERPRPALCAVMGNRLHTLAETIPESGEISFRDVSTREGALVYSRSMSFLLARAADEMFPGARVIVDYSINRALYCQLKWRRRLTAADVVRIEGRMRELVALDEPFEPAEMEAAQAREAFLAAERPDVAALLPDAGTVQAVRCGTRLDLYYGPLAPSTGVLKLFRLQYFMPGLLLHMAHMASPDAVPAYQEMPKVTAAHCHTSEFDHLVGVTTIAELNHAVRSGRARQIVRVCEAEQDGRIAEIAEHICRERRRIVLVAGPSSSGKTTFANRLMVHLRTCGLDPIALSLDDYYLDREICPLQPDGTVDLESVDALDIPLFEEQMTALLAGEPVDLARFDFLTGKSGRAGTPITIGRGQPLIIEGINALNERLSRGIPGSIKFRVFATALTHLNVDDHNRVATTDLRLLRRIVRDSISRGRSADRTIEDWPTVHGAEFRNIFPLQENADVTFNSAMAYELAALRTKALPMLQEIPQEHPSYLEAERLLAFLKLVEPLGCEDEIPPTSIVREFIGGNTFYQ